MSTGEGAVGGHGPSALLVTRAARALADGLVAASFAGLLRAHGWDERTLGWMITATLLGSSTMLVLAARHPARLTPSRVLLLSGVLMAATGVAFGTTASLLVLVPLAVVGPLNPTGGDVSAFLPAEQALLADATTDERRSTVFARYSLAGFAGATAGGLLAGPVAAVGREIGFASTRGTALAPLIYAGIGVGVTVAYLRMARVTRSVPRPTPSPLVESRRVVRALAVTFALDSAGGGFLGSALVGAFLARRFGLDLGEIGLVLGLASAAGALSSLIAPRLSRRFGLVETMAFTHMPANVLCIAAGLAPTAPIAVALLILRATMSQLDVPARQTFVMTVVPPAERAAAAAYTNLPRSLAAAATPPVAGWLLHHSPNGWPLVAGGAIKLAYDVILLVRFRSLSTRA